MNSGFIIEGSSKGCNNKRFIKMVGGGHKVISCDVVEELSGDIFDDALIPLSISVGKYKYWSFDKAWCLLEFPNKKVTEIIREKFVKKYGEFNIIMEDYISNHSGEPKSYLMVIRSEAVAMIYLDILMANKISKEFIDVDDVYIGVNNDPNVKDNIITNSGNPEQYHLIPNVLRDRMKKLCENETLDNPADINGAELSMDLSDEQSKKFNHLMNDRFENLSIEDIAYFSDHFKSILENNDLNVSIISSKKGGTIQEHNIPDIIKKIESANAQKRYESILEELGDA